MNLKILAVGDSHIGVWKLVRKSIYKNNKDFNMIISKLSGTTAQGLYKMDQSILKSGYKISKLINSNINCDYIIISAGSVDIDYCYYNKIMNGRNNINLKSEINYIFKNYIKYIDEILLNHFDSNKIIIQLLHLPTMESDIHSLMLNKKYNKMIEVDSLFIRTKYVNKLNNKLKNYCNKIGIYYIDINAYIMNNETKMIGIKYKNKRKFDTHLNHNIVYSFYLEELSNIIFSNSLKNINLLNYE